MEGRLVIWPGKSSESYSDWNLGLRLLFEQATDSSDPKLIRLNGRCCSLALSKHKTANGNLEVGQCESASLAAFYEWRLTNPLSIPTPDCRVWEATGHF